MGNGFNSCLAIEKNEERKGIIVGVKKTDDRPVIVIDSREQRPWMFSIINKNIKTVTRKLETGDYSILGFEDRISIERKSLNDIANTVGANRIRFLKELTRMQRMRQHEDGYAAIIIEGDLMNIILGNYASSITPQSLFGFLCHAQVVLGIPVHFAGNRAIATNLAYKLLMIAAQQSAKIMDAMADSSYGSAISID